MDHEEGDDCPEQDCDGTLECAEVIDCSCHINPPCSSCVDAGYACGKCGWESNPERRKRYESRYEDPPRVSRVDRSDETTSTYTCSPYNSTPFTRCCETAAINTERCPRCNARIVYHDDGLAARRREVGPGNCLMCAKPRGPIEISGNCCC